jgi:hypothetical protein
MNKKLFKIVSSLESIQPMILLVRLLTVLKEVHEKENILKLLYLYLFLKLLMLFEQQNITIEMNSIIGFWMLLVNEFLSF